MEALICLKEIEEPYVYHSLLYDEYKSNNSKYCVIAENYFIIFNSFSDVISSARIPLNLNIKLEIEKNNFTVIAGKFRFRFYHEDVSVIEKWVELLRIEIYKDKKDIITDFYAEEVEIDKIKSDCCSILIEKYGYKLFIYESHEHHISDIVKHIINLRFYISKNIELQSYSILPSLNHGHIVTIRGAKEDIKIIFKELNQAKLWHKLFHQATITFSCCSLEIINDLLVTEHVIPDKENNNYESIFEGIFNLSYNNCDKMYTLFLVCLYNDMIVIEVESPNVIFKEKIIVCTIYLSNVNFVLYNSSKDILRVSFTPQCDFSLKRNNCEETVEIDELFLYDPHISSLKKLKNILFNNILSNVYEPPTEETSLFVLCYVQINKEGLTKCKCHITQHQLILSSSINMKFDLTLSENITLVDNKLTVLINLPNYDISLQSQNNNLLMSMLEEASKIRILSLKDKSTILKLQKLIHFITTYGLKCEGIFRICGQSIKSEFLFNTLLEAENNFSINPAEYSVHDVTSCLKKCMMNLFEPLIPKDLFIKFVHTSHIEDKEKRQYAIKSYLKLLPEENYNVLQEIIELLFMIIEMSEFNKMNCANLCTSTTMSLISSEIEHLIDSATILKCLIENFLYLFDYSNEKENILRIFLKSLKSPSQTYVLRTFYFNSSLKFLVNSNIQIVEESRLKINNESNLFSLSFNVDCKTVRGVYSIIFQKDSFEKINLWHVFDIKNKFFKRLLYLDENIENIIVNGYRFPISLYGSMHVNNFYFDEMKEQDKSKFIGTIYQCNIKIKNIKSIQLLQIESSNCLKIFDAKLGNEIINLKLSDIDLYRAYGFSPTKILIFCNDKEMINIDFENTEEFCDFLLYFDNFRLKNNLLKTSL